MKADLKRRCQVLGLACFINLAGIEKAVLAVIVGWLALKSTPAPQLTAHLVWAQTGLVLGIVVVLVVPTIVILNRNVRDFKRTGAMSN